MGIFTNLYFAGDAVRRAIATIPQAPTVLVGAPLPDPQSTPRITVTMMMVNEEPGHKNDPALRNPDGTTTAPPTSLSVSYLVTSEGLTPQGDAADAHQLLGQVLRLFHDTPELDLAALGFNATQGEGRLHIAHVPMTPELMEKLFTPLQVKHRPFALFEVWPVQLRTTFPVGPPSAAVRPGGVSLSGPAPAARPVMRQVHPKRVAQGGFLRIEGPFAQPVSAVVVGSEILTGGALGAIVGLTLSDAVRVQLDAATFSPGRRAVHVLTQGNLASDSDEILIEPGQTPTLDGPSVASYSLASSPLVLTGVALSQVSRLYLWPHGGVSQPADVRTFNAVAAPTTVTAPVTNLTPGVYRVSAEVSVGPGVPLQFTPYVLLEVVP